MSTPFIMSSIKDAKYKKEIEFKLVNKILALEFNNNTEKLFINGLKCAIELFKRNWMTNVSKFLELKI
jgi:hypothetical protein